MNSLVSDLVFGPWHRHFGDGLAQPRNMAESALYRLRARQPTALADDPLVYGLARRPANIKGFDDRAPLVHHVEHGIQTLRGPLSIQTALLRQLKQMLAANVLAFATNIHLMLTARPSAVRQVKARRQFPVPLRVHAVREVFGVVIPVVK